MYTYKVPLEALGLSPEASARYSALIASDSGRLPWDNGGVASSLARDLPKVLPPWTPPDAMERGEKPWQDDGRVIYFFPIAPFALCATTDLWGVEPTNPLLAAKGGFARWRSAGAMYSANRVCLRNTTLSCPAYDRALEWMLARPSWHAAMHRHALVLLSVEASRLAFACDLRRNVPLHERSVYSRVATAILVSTEGRRWSWREERRRGFLVVTPQWWPSFFMYNGTEAALPAAKVEPIAFKTVDAKTCHRFDDETHPSKFVCAERGVPTADPFKVRAALGKALLQLEKAQPHNGTHKAISIDVRTGRVSFMRSVEHHMRAFAAQYKAATFTLVPHGDTVTSSRIYQAVAALSIPIFLIELEHLPFQGLVPWREISFSLDPHRLIEWASLANANASGVPNPLLRFVELHREMPHRLRAMQRGLALARWHLLYHWGDVPAAPFAKGERLFAPGAGPSAARSVAHELVIAAHVRELDFQANASASDAWPFVTPTELKRHAQSASTRAGS